MSSSVMLFPYPDGLCRECGFALSLCLLAFLECLVLRRRGLADEIVWCAVCGASDIAPLRLHSYVFHHEVKAVDDEGVVENDLLVARYFDDQPVERQRDVWQGLPVLPAKNLDFVIVLGKPARVGSQLDLV